MKTSVVTGGASGIGLEFVKLLLNDNYKVFIIDNNDKQADGFQGAQPYETFERVIESMLEN